MQEQSKHPLCEAVRSLRSARGETQEAFGAQFGVTVRTVARWETVRPPRGIVLMQLASIADAAKESKLASAFRTALAGDIKWVPRVEHFILYPEKPEEVLLVSALLRAFRNPHHSGVRSQLGVLLKEPAREVMEYYETISLRDDMLSHIDEMIAAGQTKEEVAQKLPLAPVDEIESRARAREMKLLSNFFAMLESGKTAEEIRAALPADFMKRFERQ